MVDSISRGFINKNRIAEEQVIDNNVNKLSKTEEQVKKGIIDFNKRLSKSIYVFSKAIHSLEDTRETRELKSKLDKAIKTSSIQDKIRKGKSVSSTEARELIQAAEDMNDVMLNNEKLRIKIKELGYKSEDLDITKPLVTASQRIAESAKEVFITNAERITQSEVGSDLAKTGVRAVSPELAFITESLGVGLPNFFESEDKEEDIVVTELEKLNDSVGNLEDATNKGNDEIRDGILDEIEYLKEVIKNNKSYPKYTEDPKLIEEVKQLEEEIKVYQNILKDMEEEGTIQQKKTVKAQIKSDKKIAEQAIQADNKRNEENLLVQADQHRDQMEILDDIKDLQNKSIFEKLMDFLDIRKSPFLKKAGVIAAATAATNAITSNTKARTIGATALSAGKTALKAGAAVGGTVLGFDALRNIREEGLTSGNIAQSAGSGALIGAAFGPLGALIGGGVGTIAAFLTDAISPEDLKTIESGFNSASDFISKGLGKGISSTIKHSKELYTAIQEGKLTEWFGKIGEGISTSIKEIRDKVNIKLNEAVSNYDWILTRIKSDINGFVTGYQNAGKSFREQYPQTSALNDELINFILTPFKDIQFFLSSPKAYLASAFSVDKTEIDYYITEIIDFLINPLQRLKEALANTVNFLGLDSLKSNEAVTSGHKEHSPSGFIGDLLGKNENDQPQIFFKQEGDLPNSPMVRYIKYPDGTEKRMPVRNYNVTSSVPEIDTSKANIPPNLESANSIEANTAQQKATQAIEQLKETQENINKETNKQKDKNKYEKDQAKLGKVSRNHDNVAFNGPIGMAILQVT